MSIRIEAGKYYRTRGGERVGPMVPYLDDEFFKWTFYNSLNQSLDCWSEAGQYRRSPTHSPRDLIAEWDQTVEAPTPQDPAVTAARAGAPGKAWMNAPLGSAPAPAASPVTKQSLLADAAETVKGRGLNYGKPEDNFQRIATLWNSHLINRYPPTAFDLPTLDPSDVSMMMVLMKVARLENQPSHLDSWTDIAGYAACGAEIACNEPTE